MTIGLRVIALASDCGIDDCGLGLSPSTPFMLYESLRCRNVSFSFIDSKGETIKNDH